jgi:hypothetical protein
MLAARVRRSTGLAPYLKYEGAFKIFRIYVWEWQPVVQLSANRCCITRVAAFQVILLSFVAIAFCVSSQQVLIRVFDRCHSLCSNYCLEITWNLYCILLKNRGHCIGKAWNAQNVFRWKCHEKKMDFEGFECSGPPRCFLPRKSYGTKRRKVCKIINGEWESSISEIPDRSGLLCDTRWGILSEDMIMYWNTAKTVLALLTGV